MWDAPRRTEAIAWIHVRQEGRDLGRARPVRGTITRGGLMVVESLVVMERGARFPIWIDEMAGRESSVRVLAQRERESEHAFEARIIDFLESSSLGSRATTRAVLACGRERGRARTTSRAVLILALRELVTKSRGAVMVVEPEGADSSIAELARLLSAELVRDAKPIETSPEQEEAAPARVA